MPSKHGCVVTRTDQVVDDHPGIALQAQNRASMQNTPRAAVVVQRLFFDPSSSADVLAGAKAKPSASRPGKEQEPRNPFHGRSPVHLDAIMRTHILEV